METRLCFKMNQPWKIYGTEFIQTLTAFVCLFLMLLLMFDIIITFGKSDSKKPILYKNTTFVRKSVKSQIFEGYVATDNWYLGVKME